MLYTISEYGIIKEKRSTKDLSASFSELHIDHISFKQLKLFIESNSGLDNDVDKAFKISFRRGEYIIKTQNYVGLIETKSGDLIEVLPKISKSNNSPSESKNVLLRMLRCLSDTPYINISESSLDLIKSRSIQEVFISNFCKELESQVNQGILSSYVGNSKNLKFVKGRINIERQIRVNTFDKTRVYCEYSKFDSNNTLNQVIKTTINLLISKTRSNNNRKTLHSLLRRFEHVDDIKTSGQIAQLEKLKINRLSFRFKKIIEWCEVFLKGQTFTNYQGDTVNYAMLFPMEKVFENFVAKQLRKHTNYKVTTQGKKGIHLLKEGNKSKFKLKPDIILESPEDGKTYILDTKWKLVNNTESSSKKNISISDLYQLYAYGKKHADTTCLALVYPGHENFQEPSNQMNYEENMPLKFIPFDLTETNSKEAIDKLISNIL